VWLSPHARQSGQRQALLRGYDVNNAVRRIANIEKAKAVRGGVGAHVADVVVLLSPRIDLRVPQRRDGMIRGTERQLGMPQRQLAAIKRKEATPGEVIEQMPVDQQEVKAFAEIGDRVLSPQLIEQSQRHRTLHAHRPSAADTSLQSAPIQRSRRYP